MAVSDKEMMAMLKGNQMPEQTPPPSEQGAMTAPMGSPMTTPEPQEGNMEQARLNVMMALGHVAKRLARVWHGVTRRHGPAKGCR
jgi:hypothetical protein